jgi:branched-chain amino acid transport system permease protein
VADTPTASQTSGAELAAGSGRGVPAYARRLGILALLAGLIALPFLVGDYQQLLATEILIYALFAISFNLLLGYTGLLSFGHAAFLAAGAYGCALAMGELDIPLWGGLVVGTLAGGLLAALYGLFCLRVNEIYFALLTLAFGMLTHTVVFQAVEITGGDDGYPVHTLGELPVLGLPLGRPDVFYFVTLAVVSLGVGAMWLIVRSPFGQTLKAMRENAERVSFFGVPVAAYRYRVLVISGTFAGLAGALLAPFLRIAGPATAHWTTSAEAVLGTVLGGAGYFLGPAVGIGVLIYLESVVTSYTVYWPLVMGLLLLPLILFFPRGLVGTTQETAQFVYRTGLVGTALHVGRALMRGLGRRRSGRRRLGRGAR